MTVELRRRLLNELIAARRAEAEAFHLVAQCGDCSHTWNPDSRKLPAGAIANWPAGTVACPKCGSTNAGIVRPTFID